MQRINLFPNPVFAGPLTGVSHWGDANGTVRDNALHVTGRNGGYGFNVAVPFNVPLVLSMRVDASEDNVAGVMVVQTTDKPDVNNMVFSQRLKRGISDVLCRFTVPSHGFRFEVNPNGIRDVAISNVLIERADTYDPAVGGGASGLLHGGHDAARIGASVGRVMPDDGDEPMHEPILDHRPESRQAGGYHDHSEQARDEISGQRLCERHRRHYLDESVWRHQRKPTCQLRVDRRRCRSDVNVLFRQVRQSDRHRDAYSHLHVGRVSGEQDPARRHRIFHREYDAGRLTLTGVVA